MRQKFLNQLFSFLYEIKYIIIYVRLKSIIHVTRISIWSQWPPFIALCLIIKQHKCCRGTPGLLLLKETHNNERKICVLLSIKNFFMQLFKYSLFKCFKFSSCVSRRSVYALLNDVALLFQFLNYPSPSWTVQHTVKREIINNENGFSCLKHKMLHL